MIGSEGERDSELVRLECGEKRRGSWNTRLTQEEWKETQEGEGIRNGRGK
jgi:hypothetical protein